MIVASANDATKTIVATIIAAILAAPSLVTLVLVVRSIARLREAFAQRRAARAERARARDARRAAREFAAQDARQRLVDELEALLELSPLRGRG